jgi:CIC family chloride channel protein
LSYGTIYTTKLLRRGIDIDRTPSADPFQDLTAADAMRPFPAPLPAGTGSSGLPDGAGRASLPGPVTRQHDPQVLFATESLTQALRQLELYGRDGLPVIADDGQQLQGWITTQNVLQAVACHIRTAEAGTAQPQPAAGPAPHGPQDDPREAPAPLGGYQVLEITIAAGSPAAGQALGDIAWPPGYVPVSVLDNRTLRDPDPGITLAPGDRVSLLARTQQNPEPGPPRGEPGSQPGDQAADAPPAGQAPGPEDHDQRPQPAQ